MSRQPTARAGKKLGRYRIERELGRGGMGVVYLAEDENTGRRVALKTTAVAGLGGREQSRNQRRQRFVREVQALGQINHDNVVHVIDAGEADDPDLGWLLFYSMEYVEGETLAQLVQRKGALEPGAAAAVLMQVAGGLGAAHHAGTGIVHRDVKPANIFISLDARALIGDFGICKIEGQTQITRRDQLVGTPNYLAPEQILGEPVSPATDVFALGALFYVITMNRPLRSHVDAAALLASAQSNEPRDRLMQERHIPEGLRKVIARCLEREPKKRWPDGTHLADALAEFATRIPSLRDETMHDPKRHDSTSADRSSPFAASPAMLPSVPSAPSGDVEEVPFANPADVEAAALALMQERFGDNQSQRTTENKPVSLDEEPPELEAKPLPVARTESTVMFNLRAMEEEEDAKSAQAQQASKAALPVARTESTAIFKMREDEGSGKSGKPPKQKAKPSGSLVRDETTSTRNRLENTSMGLHDEDTPIGHSGDGDENGGDTDGDDATQRHPAVRSFDANATKKPRRRAPAIKLPKINLPNLPRPAWLGITAGAGALLGIILVVALAPPSYSKEKPATSTELAVEPLTKRPRPTLCPKDKDNIVLSKADADQARAYLDNAREGGLKGSKLTEREEMLGKAMMLNPLDPDVYFELSKVYEAQNRPGLRDQAYQCTCVVAETSDSCHKVLRLMNR